MTKIMDTPFDILNRYAHLVLDVCLSELTMILSSYEMNVTRFQVGSRSSPSAG